MNTTEETAERPRRIGVLVAVAAAALAIDAISKVVVVALLEDREPAELLGGLLKLRVLRNSGAAFNIGNGMTFVFTVIATGVVVAIIRYARRLRSLPWAVTLGLLLGGALGNLSDRLLRSPGPLRGHVVDWIELPHWPVFNLADSAIVCGGALAVLLASRGLQVDGTVFRDDAPKAGTPERRHAPAGDPETGAGDAPAAVAGAPDAPASPAAPDARTAPGAPAGDGVVAAPSGDPAGAEPANGTAGSASGEPASERPASEVEPRRGPAVNGRAAAAGGSPDAGASADDPSVRDAKH